MHDTPLRSPTRSSCAATMAQAPPSLNTRSSSKTAASDAPPERPAKKQRAQTDERWVLLVPFDDPFRPVLADRTLLELYECRTALMLKHSAPDCEMEGRPAYNVNMSRSLLVAFLKALTHGEFVYPRDVDAHEVVRTFEYEGIAMPGNGIATRGAAPEVPLPTLGQRHRQEGKTSPLTLQISQLVHAILEWPRLACGMEEAGKGNNPGFSCTGSRVWIAFAPRPAMPHMPDKDATFQLVRKRPHWLVASLQAIGQVNWRMHNAGKLDALARDEQSFVTLAREGVEIDPTYMFLSCRRDLPREARNEQRAMCQASDAFARWVLSTVDAHGADAHDKPMPTPVKYARVCIKLAIDMMQRSPNLPFLFGGACAAIATPTNANGACATTPERAALAKGLKTHGIKLLGWAEPGGVGNVTPLIFPPAYRSGAAQYGPYMLLERDEVR